jgi:hypothetical protein
MKLNEDELYIKIIAIHAIYDYLVEKILIWNHLVSQNIVLSSHISKF